MTQRLLAGLPVPALALAAGLVALLALWAWKGLAQRQRPPDALPIYKRVDGHALALHLFRPTAAPAGVAVPALLLFHGGGWQHGDATQFHPQCRYFSARGLACVSASYRTASAHGSTPGDALQDARDAMRYLRRHAGELGIAPDHIAAGGGSAGAQLAAALGTAVPWPDPGADPALSTRPDALLLLNPMIDLAPGMPDHDRVAEHWHALSPAHHVDRRVPPTLIISGSMDAEVAPATLAGFCRAVQQAGQTCELLIYPGAAHGFFNPGVAGGRFHQRTNQDIERFLARIGFLPAGTP